MIRKYVSIIEDISRTVTDQSYGQGKIYIHFTLSELCIVLNIREKDQQEAHVLLIIYFN